MNKNRIYMTEHAAQRAQSRFGITTEAEMTIVKNRVFDPDYFVFLSDMGNGRETRKIEFNGNEIDVVVNPSRRMIITFLPPNMIGDSVIVRKNQANYESEIAELWFEIRKLQATVANMKIPFYKKFFSRLKGKWLNVWRKICKC